VIFSVFEVSCHPLRWVYTERDRERGLRLWSK